VFDAWGVAIALIGVFLVILGITGKGGDVLNGARTKAGAPTKSYSS
jgi:hypothetical protein